MDARTRFIATNNDVAVGRWLVALALFALVALLALASSAPFGG
jgi:hypothetical protein